MEALPCTTSPDNHPLHSGARPPWLYVPSTIAPEWGDFIKTVSVGRNGPMPAPDDLSAWIANEDAIRAELEPLVDAAAETFGVTYRETEIGGVPVLTVTPRALRTDKQIAVYTHGGAYVRHSAKTQFVAAAMFARDTGLTVQSIDYTLAPHVQWQGMTDEILSVFAGLEQKGYPAKDIVLFGDSSGGGLASGSVLKMRDQGRELPAALILWSPWSDITNTGDSYVTLQDAEPFYTYDEVLGPAALAYAPLDDQRHPYVSPVYGDYTQGFPPTLIQGGTKELFLSNIVRHYQAIDQAGQTVRLDLYEGMPHVFMSALPESKEARAAMAKVKAWVAEHLLKDT